MNFGYCGCFVLLFIGLLYFGLLVGVFVSWFDVCVYGGIWFVCIEDFDGLCMVFGVVDDIFVIFVYFGMMFDELFVW